MFECDECDSGDQVVIIRWSNTGRGRDQQHSAERHCHKQQCLKIKSAFLIPSKTMAKKSHQLEGHSEQGTPRHILRGRHALAGAPRVSRVFINCVIDQVIVLRSDQRKDHPVAASCHTNSAYFYSQ